MRKGCAGVDQVRSSRTIVRLPAPTGMMTPVYRHTTSTHSRERASRLPLLAGRSWVGDVGSGGAGASGSDGRG